MNNVVILDIPIPQTKELHRREASPMIQHPIACHMSKGPHAVDPSYPMKITRIKEPSKTMSDISKRFSYSFICSLTIKISGAWKSLVSYPTRPFRRTTDGKRIGGSFERRSFLECSLENLRRRVSSGTVSR